MTADNQLRDPWASPSWPQEVAARDKTREGVWASRIRLLVIEDDPEDRTALQRKISREHLNIDLCIVDSIAEAKKALSGSEYDVVIADFQLTDGTIDQLTSEFHKRNIPFIITTGNEDQNTAVLLMKAGAADYLVKDHYREYLVRLPYVLNHVLYTDRLKKKAEQEAATFRALFYESADASLIIENGYIRDVNNATNTLFRGGKKGDLVGNPFSRYLAAEVNGTHQAETDIAEILGQVHLTGSIRIVTRLIRQDESSFFSELTCTRLVRERRELIHVVVRDITERVQAQNKVQATLAELQEKNAELDRLATGLVTLNQDLEKKVAERTSDVFSLIKKKNELITRIGHDLRTPLTPILGLLPVLLEEITEPELTEMLIRIESNAKNLNQIITKVFDLTRLYSPGQGKDITWRRLKSSLNYAIEQNMEIIRERKIVIRYHHTENISILIDPDHLDLILDSLVNNAIKFSSPGGIIDISCIQNARFFSILIEDTGAGIAESDLPYIFDEFYCADPSRHDRGSHGLGLPMVKQIISLYGGTIGAENRDDIEGARFTISFQDHACKIEWDEQNNQEHISG